VPASADLAPRAGDLLAVEIDPEVVADVSALVAVLAGWVAGQRAGEGDLVEVGGPLHQDQGGIAAVGQVGGGQQAPAGQPGVDAGQGRGVVAGGGHDRDIGAGHGHLGQVAAPAGDLAPAGVAGGRVLRRDDPQG
jgi:hypothetical protein